MSIRIVLIVLSIHILKSPIFFGLGLNLISSKGDHASEC